MRSKQAKLDLGARKPRAASLPVRNHYWRVQPEKPARAKVGKPAASKVAPRKQRELPVPPRSAIRTLPSVQKWKLVPTSVASACVGVRARRSSGHERQQGERNDSRIGSTISIHLNTVSSQ